MSVAFGDFVFDPQMRELSHQGAPLKVDAKLLQLLDYFLANPGRLLSKRELLEQVWEGRAVADNVLSVSVAKLRKVLGHKTGELEYIENSYGRGYRFVREVQKVEVPARRAPASTGSFGSSAAPLVGRDTELGRLQGALARAQAGKGSICLLMGEPGIGKTRLAETLEASARENGVATAWGRCQAADGVPPLWPFVQMLRELHGNDLADEIVRVVIEGPSSGQGPQDSPSAAAMLNQSGLFDTVHASHRAIDSVAQALFRASKHKPLLLLVDDLQWADAASARLLCYMVGEISRWPILVLATYRGAELAEEKGERGLLRLFAHANCERILLERLESEQVREYVSAVFGADVSDLSRAVYARSEGNPFFMIELLRPVIGMPNPTADQLQVSGAARELVRERLGRLPEVAREVLSAAAVIGQDFDLGVLSHVTETAPHELLEALDGSLANETVVPSDDLAGAYAFDHALIREVLYSDLSIRKRCHFHIRAGEALLKRRASGGEVSSAELAHHFLSALPHGEVKTAVAYAREAAAVAATLGAHADARSLLRRALAALRFAVEPDAELRTALLLELAIVERFVGEPMYYEHLQQGIELARSLKLGAMLTLAGQFLSPGPGILSDVDAAGVLEAAFEVLPANDFKRRAIVRATQAWTPPHSSSAQQVAELLEQARDYLKRANAGENSEARAVVRDAELYFSAGPATFSRAEAIAREIDRELLNHPNRYSRWRATSTPIFRIITAAQRGNAEGVQRAVDELTTLHQQLNNTELLWHHDRMLMIQRMNRGEWSSIPAELERLRERAKRLRFQAWRAIFALDYGVYLLHAGDARAFGSRARASFSPSSQDLPNSRSLKIRSLAEHGFLHEARAALEELSLDALRDLPQDRDYLSVLGDLATTASMTGAREHAAVLYELLQPYASYFAVGISFHLHASIAHLLGNLAALLGEPVRAVDYLLLGIDSSRRFGARTCLVYNLIDTAKLMAQPGPAHDATRARQLLTEAAELSAQLGMSPAHGVATQLLGY